MTNDFDFILFDLGGVLVELQGADDFMKWMRGSATPEEQSQLWLHADSVRLYEAGKIGSAEFSKRVVRELQLDVSPEEFLVQFKKFPLGLFKGIAELLNKVKRNYRIGCLSNTNDIHWDWLSENTELESLLDFVFLSFRIGLMKPDQEIFDYVARALACKPERILFFDDNPTNVGAAKKAGIQASLVRGVLELEKALKERGIIA